MAGVQIRVDFEEAEALAAIDRIEGGAQETLPLMDAIGVVLVDGTIRRFQAGIGPDGVPWKPSFRAQLSGGQTLIDSTRLLSSITHQAEPREVRVGTNVPYALIHQLGGEIRPVNAQALRFQLADGTFVTVGKVTIPARPFLGIDQEDREEIEDQVRLFIEDIVQ
ncbi:MAG: phage virion morphogenesis protein [Pseudomonadota bacterium]